MRRETHEESIEGIDMHKCVEELTLVRKRIMHLRIQLAEAMEKDKTMSSYLKEIHDLHI